MSRIDETCRLQTPRAAGYRAGMTSSGIIAHRLESLYEVPAETPQRFDDLLRVLDQGDDDGD